MKLLKFVFTIFLTALLVINTSLIGNAYQKYGHQQYSESQSASSSVGVYYGRSETLNAEAANAYLKMKSDAANAGVRLDIVSGFRTESDQADLWQRQIARQGSESAAAKLSAPPGHSEHHTGYAMDLRDVDQPDTDLKMSFESSRAYQWLQQNGAKYGFEMSFPSGNAQGVSYEPWHWRYVGSPTAKTIFGKPQVAAAVSQPSTPPVSSAPAPAPNVPNVTDQSFGDFKLEQSGSVQATPETLAALQESDGSTNYQWNKGESLANVLNLGDIGHLKPEEMTMREVAEKTGKDIENTPLADVHMLGLQTIGSLTDAIPGLPNMPIRALQPVADLVERAGKSYAKAWLMKNLDAPLAKLLKVDPALKDMKVSQMALQDFAVGSIPGLSDTPIGNFPGWQQAKIAGIPGLESLPMKDFPGGISLNDISVIGIVDVVYGPNESTASYKPITGSDVEGYKVPCLQGNCAYLELRDPLGTDAPLHGARWIKGGKEEEGGQMVKGGSGLLGAAFGGKEPTGRNPFGDEANMKVVLTNTTESDGSAELSIYMRVKKKGFGATPYIFGPIPFMSINEGDTVPVGIDGQSSFTTPNLEVPDSVRREIEQVDAQYDTQDSTADSDCADAAIKATDSGYASFAQQYIPMILKEAEKAELTENQTAYVLATARHESGMGKFMELMGDRSSWGKYYARGFVGLTHDYNYKKWSDILGMDLVNNPDLAAKPEISARILVEGMKRGEFTGYKLDEFINESQANFYDARAVINGVKDGAQMYANTASQYQKALKSCMGFAGSCGDTGKMAMPAQGVLTSPFGYRLHPTLGIMKLHTGQDIGAQEGTPIVAADCGKVIFAGDGGGYGNLVEIEHKNGLRTLYAHQSVMKVKQGQPVGRGQAIGSVGSTGRSTGPHLHFEVLKNGQAQDPTGYL